MDEQLQQAGIPCFWATIAQIRQIQVFQVKYFLESAPKATVVCRNESKSTRFFHF